MNTAKCKLLICLIVLLITGGKILSQEIIKIKSFDNTIITGKLDMPKNSISVPYLVIYVPGTGPNTYDTHRSYKDKEFNYYDLFAIEICKHNVGFFRYNSRGVVLGKKAPWYDSVNVAEYMKNTPTVHAMDIESMIAELKKESRFKDSKIILLCWSEGTIIAPMVAERNKVPIHALIFGGYANDNFFDIMDWQLNGSNRLILLDQLLGKSLGENITKEEYENIPAEKKESPIIKNISFDKYDLDKDGLITAKDLEVLLKPVKEAVMGAVERGDDNWIWNNYFRITTDYIKRHMQLAPNKVRLLNLDLPIYIFHGIYDANAPVSGVYDIQRRFKIANKNNLHVKIYDKWDHNLDYGEFIKSGTITQGYKDIFETIGKIAEGKIEPEANPAPVKLTKIVAYEDANSNREAVMGDLTIIALMAQKDYQEKKTFIGWSIPADKQKNKNGTFVIEKAEKDEIVLSGEGVLAPNGSNSKVKVSMRVGPKKIISTTITY